jgi:PhzF family phenazine biosynthesis protein
MKLSMCIIDAFAERTLAGNPAAVCPLESWLPESTMQAIAAEMNLAETVFFAPEPGSERYAIRWFTPTREVDLIGHATLAAGHFVLQRLRPGADSVRFTSGKDEFTVARQGDMLWLEMPALPPRAIDAPAALATALGRTPNAVLAAKHYLCLYDTPAEILTLAPHMGALARLDLPAVIVSAPGDGAVDFVSRFFAPANGVPEDHVSGVAHLCLAPYWAQRLGKPILTGRQLSQRGGTVRCEHLGARVRLGGRAAVFLEGQIAI